MAWRRLQPPTHRATRTSLTMVIYVMGIIPSWSFLSGPRPTQVLDCRRLLFYQMDRSCNLVENHDGECFKNFKEEHFGPIWSSPIHFNRQWDTIHRQET